MLQPCSTSPRSIDGDDIATRVFRQFQAHHGLECLKAAFQAASDAASGFADEPLASSVLTAGLTSDDGLVDVCGSAPHPDINPKRIQAEARLSPPALPRFSSLRIPCYPRTKPCEAHGQIHLSARRTWLRLTQQPWRSTSRCRANDDAIRYAGDLLYLLRRN